MISFSWLFFVAIYFMTVGSVMASFIAFLMLVEGFDSEDVPSFKILIISMFWPICLIYLFFEDLYQKVKK